MFSKPESIAGGSLGSRGPSTPETDSERSLLVGELVRFVRQVVVPLEDLHREQLDDPWQEFQADGRVSPWLVRLRQQVRQAAAKAGFYTAPVPRELGGGGVKSVSLFLMWEALFRNFGPSRPLPYETLSHFATGPSVALLQIGEAAARTTLPRLLSGEASMCFAVSEPDAGSDVWNLKTVARRHDGEWIINGTKQWTTNGAHADYALVFAVTDQDLVARRAGGITCFLVDTETPGFKVESIIRLYGHVGGHEAILSFTDMHVQDSCVVGRVNDGFGVAIAGISAGRVYNCARSVGLARWGLELATKYASNRVAFGKPIAEYQAIQWQLADSAIDIYAARAMSLDCAEKLERGLPAVMELAMSKAFATEAACRTIDRCMQVLGAMGLTNDVKLFDAWEQIRAVRIAEGSGEIMRRTIAKELLRGNYEF